MIENIKGVSDTETVLNTDGQLPAKTEAFKRLTDGVYQALRTYSNVHRGSGHKSMISTHLYELARRIILEYMNLSTKKYHVIFCSPGRVDYFISYLETGSYQILSSRDLGLALGVRAIIVKKKKIPGDIPYLVGGGTTRLYSRDWVIWTDAPDRFEAGTPPIINIITFALALRLTGIYGKKVFMDPVTHSNPVEEWLYMDRFLNYSGYELLEKLRQELIGKNLEVPTSEGPRNHINMDNSASTPTFYEVWETYTRSIKLPGVKQQEIIREVKSICAGFLGAPLSEYDIFFTSNTTESINLLAKTLGRYPDDSMEPVIVNTIMEHSSNDLPWRMVPGFSVIKLSVNEVGKWNLKELETILSSYNIEKSFGKKRIQMVSVCGASNVLGVCNDLEEISRIVHRYGAHFFVDAAQLVAHRQVNMKVDGIDFLAFSAHKIYAPFGCGVLVIKKGILSIHPSDSDQEYRLGEENAGGIAALGKAILLVQRIGFEVIGDLEHKLLRKALQGMSVLPGLQIYGIQNPANPVLDDRIGVIVFDIKNMMAGSVAKKLALHKGIGVRYGCHCAHLIVKQLFHFTPFLEDLQRLIVRIFPRIKLQGMVRVSFGLENTEAEVDILLDELTRITAREKRPVPSELSGGSIPVFRKTTTVQRESEEMMRIKEEVVYSLSECRT